MTATTPTDGLTITERHRPRCLAEVVGQTWVVNQLSDWLAAPHSWAILLVGDTGTGKSSTGRALAGELGCNLDEPELGGYRTIKAGDQTADAIRDAIRHLWTRPMFSRDGWKVLVIEEADRMSEAVAYLWLSALEDLPARTVVAFTTNHADKFPARFLDRCERLEFESRADVMAPDVERLIASIWEKETGRMDPPKLDDLPGVVDDDGTISIRRAVAALGPLGRRRGPGPMPPAPRRPNVLPVTTRVRNPKVEPGLPTAAGLLDDLPATPKYAGDDYAKLAKHREQLLDLYNELGLKCEEVDQAVIATTAKMKIIQKRRADEKKRKK